MGHRWLDWDGNAKNSIAAVHIPSSVAQAVLTRRLTFYKGPAMRCNYSKVAEPKGSQPIERIMHICFVKFNIRFRKVFPVKLILNLDSIDFEKPNERTGESERMVWEEGGGGGWRRYISTSKPCSSFRPVVLPPCHNS